MNRLPFLCVLALMLGACGSFSPSKPRAAAGATGVAAPLAGEYDNHEQVWTARDAAGIAAPHVLVSIEALSAEWSIWRIHLDAPNPLDATWAMRRVGDKGGTGLVPYRAIVATAAGGSAFDAREWAALDACALRGSTDAQGLHLAADANACAVLTPGIGAQAALLPLALDHEGEWLRLRLYVDQTRGAEAREELRAVQVFGGWAAVNGAGQKAAADSSDWHMDRSIRLGSEGGRYALKYRDGHPSGYSLTLERLTYRDGNVPVLKLSVIDDASGGTLAYAWANPEAARIGLNLGWLQVGLERTSPQAVRSGP
jgi:hypothetical protein